MVSNTFRVRSNLSRVYRLVSLALSLSFSLSLLRISSSHQFGRFAVHVFDVAQQATQYPGFLVVLLRKRCGSLQKIVSPNCPPLF